MIRILMHTCKDLKDSYPALVRLGRFIFGGGVGAAVDIALLYFLTDFLHVWFVLSTALAFLAAFIVSFILQKYWTFEDHSNDKIRLQLGLYFGVAIGNTVLNTFIVYALVSLFALHYLLAQIIASLIIALESYFIYRILFINMNSSSPGDVEHV